jgi:hypothetical protein
MGCARIDRPCGQAALFGGFQGVACEALGAGSADECRATEVIVQYYAVRVDGGRQYGNNWLREGSRGP